jgi:methylglutamate dehydrogenase subunit C
MPGPEDRSLKACARQPYRLATGGQIDRAQPLSFTFDGRAHQGFAGDTLAAALLAGGRRLIGRSFKYHRPRGIFTADSSEPNALIELRSGARREPNTRATLIELYEGLEARSQNRWPSLRFDVGAISGWFAPVLPAGFYYKTFMWPPAAWERLYEPLIRRAAGLGRASALPDPDRYEVTHGFCDLLVVGAGPAGLAAALTAGRSGLRVLLCEEDALLGGRLNGEQRLIDGAPALSWARAVEAELASLPNVQVLRRTTVFGLYDGGPSGARSVGALERVSDHLPEPEPHEPRQRLWRIVASRILLASGALERPLTFVGNDVPGVMLASAVRTYLHRFAVAAGRRCMIYTTSDDGWRTAFDLAAAGTAVEAIVEARPEIPAALLAHAASRGLRVLLGAQVTQAHGQPQLAAVQIREAGGNLTWLSADCLAVAGGWDPNFALATHLGGRGRWAETIGSFVAEELPPGTAAAGAARGSLTLAEALREGAVAGGEAAHAAGFRVLRAAHWASDEESQAATPLWPGADLSGKAFIDLQNDVTVADVQLAVREGFGAAEHLKRYTTLGMATDQGKLSNLNGLALLATLRGQSLKDLATPKPRPPYVPVAVGALAGAHRGRHFRPVRRTPTHSWAEGIGAQFMEAGPWLRAQWYARPGESDWLTTVTREARAVRASVGVCDVSTLGKFEVSGPDAARFLDRIYSNMMSTLAPGKVRYGLMLREDGMVMDDGTATRLAEKDYFISTTTANAARIRQHLLFASQVLWPDLAVRIQDATEQWAQLAVAGPRARALLEVLLGETATLSNEALPYMGYGEFQWRGVPLRVYRISFSGELAYELAVPTRYGDHLIREIMRSGAAFDVTPYGLEALGVLRIEKGHFGGAEINGTTTATDLGLARMVSNKKTCIGAALARRPGLIDAARPALIGIRPVRQDARLRAGAHLLPVQAANTLENDEGHVTSVAYSPHLNSWIGLALLARGAQRMGEHVRAYDPVREGNVEVEVVSPHFIDPEGARLRV